MRTVGIGFLVALLVFAVLDGAWLGFVARDFYKSRLEGVLRDQPLWIPAVLFYLVHAAGVAVFALPLARNDGTLLGAAGYGALYGLCVYAAYDLTNLATLRGWSATLTVVDLAWGTVVTALATVAAFLAVR